MPTETKPITLEFFKTRYRCELQRREYVNGGVALAAIDAETFEPVAHLTVWLPDIPEGHVAVKNYSENEGLLPQLIEQEIVGEPVAHQRSGFVTIPICPLLWKEET